jgi:hypothetical protein
MKIFECFHSGLSGIFPLAFQRDYRAVLCPGTRILFLHAQEKYPKEGAPTKISPCGPVCSVGFAKFWELASLRQPKILDAPPRAHT